ncbi:MAG: hypothetical protein ACK5KO_02805 [Arachnia sp.]
MVKKLLRLASAAFLVVLIVNLLDRKAARERHELWAEATDTVG